jgi:hypothetical protein
MYERLGFRWASGLVAFLSLLCAPMPFLFYKYGPTIRAKSRFAPTAPSASPATPPTEEEKKVAVVEVPADESQNALENTHSRHSHVSRHSHRHQHIKYPQPSPDSALEPEWGPNAGEPVAPVEMTGQQAPRVYRGEDAV